MKGLKTLFSKQDEYSRLKTQLKNLEEQLQHLINRKLVNSSRLPDLRREFAAILGARRKLPLQTQKKLQDRIDNFLEKYKEYRFDESIEWSKSDSALNMSNIGSSEMHSTCSNYCHTSSPDNKQTSCQISFCGKWEKPRNEVLSSNEADRTLHTPNEFLQSHDVEMKDLSERSRDVDQDAEMAKEVKSLPNRRSSLQGKQKNEETVGARRRSNEGTGNFQHNEGNKEISSHGVSRKDGNTQTTPSQSNTTKPALEERFQNLKTKSDVSSDARKREAYRNQHQIGRMENSSRRLSSDFQQKQEMSENFERLNQKIEHKTCRHYEETHFDSSIEQGLRHRKNLESASSRIAKSVSHEIKSPNEKRNQDRRSWGNQAAIYEQHRHQCEEEREDVRIQIEEYNLNKDIEKVAKFISEDKKNEKSLREVKHRYIHGCQPAFSGPTLVFEKDEFTTIVRQQPQGEGKEKGGQGAIENSLERQGQENPSKNDQNRSRHDLENKDQHKNIETSREIRGRGRPMSDRTHNESMTLDQELSPVERGNCQQQHRRSPGVARPVRASDNRRTEVASEAVKKEPLQILDVHKYFQDDFDLKSLDAIDAITQIETVKEWAETFEEKVSNFSEAKFSLEYFVLDEKLMRFIEHLDKLKCREDKVATQKKIEVIGYIKGLHETLDTRAVDE